MTGYHPLNANLELPMVRETLDGLAEGAASSSTPMKEVDT
jgi:hypothetical protein